MGPFMVTEAEFAVLLVLPAPVPAHPAQPYCSSPVTVGAVALIATVDPTSYQPLVGLTDP